MDERKVGRPTTTSLDHAFANRIISARQAKGLTQEELAHALRVSRRSVAYWEGGFLGGISVSRVAQIAQVLTCNPRTLAYGKRRNGEPV